LVVFTGTAWSPRELRYRGRAGIRIALSSRGRRVALLTFEDRYSRRLIVVSPAAGDAQQDVSGLITNFSLVQCESLRISGDGARLALGSREAFAVIDLSTAKTVLDGRGCFPSLSPDGETVAFVDESSVLVIMSLKGQKKKAPLSRWWTTSGVSAWSPDGRFLLAGVTEFPSIVVTLAAIEVSTGEIFEIMRLNECDRGGGYAWIKKGLLCAACRGS
jgi:Tol biopolymer transport system component